MDMTIKLEDGYFNYRVAAVIIHNDRLLVMHNKKCDTYYLPGGRVQLYESSQAAIVREIKEELLIDINNLRPLWLHETFFVEESVNKKFHELCIYYLVDISDTYFKHFGDEFILKEQDKNNYFKWIAFDKLSEQVVYPLFIKNEIYNLPEHIEIKVDYEY